MSRFAKNCTIKIQVVLRTGTGTINSRESIFYFQFFDIIRANTQHTIDPKTKHRHTMINNQKLISTICFILSSYITLSSHLIPYANATTTTELNPKTFQEFLDSGKNGMVKFFQSWCGHCKRMKPDWDQLAKEETSNTVLIADVDCGKENDLCKENNVRGYPTIKYYINGEEHDYEGGRSYDELKNFVSSTLIVPCRLSDVDGTCSEQARNYVEKWIAKSKSDSNLVSLEMKRLTSMKNESMTPTLKRWLVERLRILRQIQNDDEDIKTEL